MEALDKIKDFMEKELKKLDDLRLKMEADFESFKTNFEKLFKPK